jgi:hypothetical protein
MAQKRFRLTEQLMTMGTEQLTKKLSEQDKLAYQQEIEQAIDEVKGFAGHLEADAEIKRIWDRLRVLNQVKELML